MKFLSMFAFTLMLIVFSITSKSEILVYEFSDQALELRFNQLTQELRCPKCQNNNLADSNAPLAVDLKDIIYEQLQAGKTNEEIVNFLKVRYGDFISYRPPVNPSTWFIWFGPFILLIAGASSIFYFVSNRRGNGSVNMNKPEANSTDEQVNAKSLVDAWQEEVQSSMGKENTESNNKNNQDGEKT